MASERIVNSIPWDNWNFFVRLLFKLSGTTLNSVSKFLRSGSASKQSLITSFSISSSLKEYESINYQYTDCSLTAVVYSSHSVIHSITLHNPF